MISKLIDFIFYRNVSAVISGLTKGVTRLGRIAERKQAESSALEEEARVLFVRSDIADAEARRAISVAENFRTLIEVPSE